MAQENSEKIIKGKIDLEGASLEGVHILNLVNEKSTVSDSNGNFSILVKEDDLLVFSAIHLEYARKSISKKEFETGFVSIKLQEKITELDEVVVTEYTKINAKDLGIINYTPKKYTPAERRLKTATDLDATLGVGMMMGVSMSLDPLFNWISGRTKLLRAELEIEKKELLLNKLDEWNEVSFYTDKLKIPSDYVDGFKIFVIYDEEIIKLLATNKKAKGNFQLAKLSVDYLNYLKENE